MHMHSVIILLFVKVHIAIIYYIAIHIYIVTKKIQNILLLEKPHALNIYLVLISCTVSYGVAIYSALYSAV